MYEGRGKAVVPSKGEKFYSHRRTRLSDSQLPASKSLFCPQHSTGVGRHSMVAHLVSLMFYSLCRSEVDGHSVVQPSQCDVYF